MISGTDYSILRNPGNVLCLVGLAAVPPLHRVPVITLRVMADEVRDVRILVEIEPKRWSSRVVRLQRVF